MIVAIVTAMLVRCVSVYACRCANINGYSMAAIKLHIVYCDIDCNRFNEQQHILLSLVTLRHYCCPCSCSSFGSMHTTAANVSMLWYTTTHLKCTVLATAHQH
jgi:hypothetical protein